MRSATTRRPIWWAALVALALVVAACGNGAEEATGGTEEGGTSVGTVRVGLICGGMTPLVAQVAMNAEAFADRGVGVEKLCFDSGSEAVQALIGGGLDVFLGSYEHVQTTREQGLDTRAYAVINDVFPYWLLTATDAPYQSVADLAGETVAVTSPGSLSDTGLRAAAESAGIEYDSMRVIGAGSGATMRAALDADQVAAGMVSEPGISELTETGEYRILWEPSFDYVSIVTLSRESWVGENQDTMVAFLDVLEQTAQRAQEDEGFALEAMRAEGFAVSEEALRQAVQRMLQAVPEGLTVPPEAVQATAQVLIDVGRIEPPAVPFEEGFNFGLLEQ